MSQRFLSALFILAASGAPTFAAELHVAIENIKFSPDILEVHKGDTVIWKNNDVVPHTVTAEADSPKQKPAFASKQLLPGHEFKWKAKKLAEINYKCLLHPAMKAKLTVK